MPNSPFDDVLSSITVENDNAAAAAASQPQPAENITAGSPIPEAAGNKPIASEDSKLPKALQPVKPADVKKVVEDPSKAATPPKDKSSLSEIEKATYSFRKQLSKRDEKHAEEIRLLKQSIEDSRKPPEKPKVREEFATDEEYINYLVDSRNKAGQEAFQKELLKQKEDLENRRRNLEEGKEAFNENAEKLFKDTESRTNFSKLLQEKFSNPILKQIFDKENVTLPYIQKSSMGPKLLEYILTDPEELKRIITIKDKEEKMIEIKVIEHELRRSLNSSSDAAGKENPSKAAPVIPVLGKLGNGSVANKRSQKEMDDEEILSWWRNNSR